MLAALFKVWQFVRSAAVRICAYTIQRLQSEETRPASPCAPDDARVALHMLRCGRQVSEKNPPLAPRQRRLQAPSPPMLTVYRPHKRILVREEDTKVSPRLWRSRPVTMPPCSTELRDTNAKASQLRMWRSVQGKSDEELLAAVQVHISRDHPELVGNCHRKHFEHGSSKTDRVPTLPDFTSQCG
jgi:hypothetical protein